MIHRCRFKNFFSFAGETEVSFLLNGHVPESDLLFESPGGARLSKLLAVIGANGSGKTNILKSVGFLDWFISKSFSTSQPDEEIPVRPHFFSEHNNSELEIEFEIQGRLYRHNLVINRNMVIHESLYHKTSRLFSFLFRRDWIESQSVYQISQNGFGFSSQEATKVRKNASLISTAAQYNVHLASKIANAFGHFFSNVSYRGRLFLDSTQLNEGSVFFYNNPALRSKMSNLLGCMDLGLKKVVIESEQKSGAEPGNSGISHIPFGVHRFNNIERRLHLLDESGGTQAAFVLLYKILPALERGGIVIIDEMESDLHPDLMFTILNLFVDPDHNPHNAQILFSCHALEVLDFLQKDQVLLVEKDMNGFSEAWRLGDMKGIRRDDNLYTKYRAGAYGAVPDLAL